MASAFSQTCDLVPDSTLLSLRSGLKEKAVKSYTGVVLSSLQREIHIVAHNPYPHDRYDVHDVHDAHDPHDPHDICDPRDPHDSYPVSDSCQRRGLNSSTASRETSRRQIVYSCSSRPRACHQGALLSLAPCVANKGARLALECYSIVPLWCPLVRRTMAGTCIYRYIHVHIYIPRRREVYFAIL